MAPLNDRNFVVQVKVGQAVAHVLDRKLENAKPLWGPEMSGVSPVSPSKRGPNVRLKHHKLKLNVISFVLLPLPLYILLNGNKVLNNILNVVVFRVNTLSLCALLLVLYVAHSKHSSLLERPVKNLFAEPAVARLECDKEFIRAH